MPKSLTGNCCCGAVSYSLKDSFSHFYFCHCQQCRKLTGSAHASNLFTSPDNITWDKGLDQVKRYDDPDRSFSMVFCTECGSALPFVSKSGQFLIVPAGSLNDEPSKPLDAQIFCEEQAVWHKKGLQAKKVEGFA